MASPGSNRLADEPSLYLRQHGANPVDWYPWGRDALERARSENKPILLSIGYSACHWCHVMERESFENDAIAKLMNEHFVSIKVDREERPDLDNVYMKSVQMMTGRGGWPMTVFLTPDLKPFYAGTYFPPDDRGGMPGFGRVLAGVARAYHEQPDKVADSGERIVAELEKIEQGGDSSVRVDEEALAGAAAALARGMDADYGGFGEAPKFPGSLCLSFLIGVDRLRPDAERCALVKTALDRMADGGIYDHLGGGFHRYSVDRYWLVPHFEKMLYDQALLAELYAEAWLAYAEPRYREVALGILDYVAREMTSPEGGFYATQDADSEGAEGKFFVWTPAEVADVVGDQDAELVCRFFDVTEQGNFEGNSILHRTVDYEQVGRMFERPAAAVEKTIERARAALFERRALRIAPATDTKTLADWNGLMIGSMARVGRLFSRTDLVQCAARAADFVRSRMLRDGRLLHFYAEGEARVDGFLDDYAFFGRGCLELFFALGRRDDVETATMCARTLTTAFADEERGGFFFTGRDGERLIARGRDGFDGALPAGNSMAADLLLRLHALTGDVVFGEAGARAVTAFTEAAVRNPYGGAYLLSAAARQRRGYATVVIVGAGQSLVEAALTVHCPEAAIISLTDDAMAEWLPEALRGKRADGAEPTAYVCRGATCGAPVRTAEELRGLLLGG
jgi:uncharacterized protein YyaL (SSP411 family)